MRRGNKTKRLAALLAAALALNVFALAPMAQQEVMTDEEAELVLDFSEVPAQNLPEDEGLPADSEDAAVAALEADEVKAQADEVGQSIEPGNIITYNGKLYQITGTSNYVTQGTSDGTFETDPSSIIGSNYTDNIILSSLSYEWTSEEAHNGNYSFKINGSGGTFVWRHSFSSEKLYVYSMWFKFDADSGVNLSDSYRHIAGAIDVATGSTHTNPIGSSTDITGGWQQDMCVFNGAGSDESKFVYWMLVGDGDVYIDDFVIYEVEEIDPIEITGFRLEDYWWETYDEIPAAGEYYHYITYANKSTEEITATFVLAMFEDGKLTSIETEDVRIGAATTSASGGVSQHNGEVSHVFTIDDDVDISKLSYMAYLITDDDPFAIQGSVSDYNPAVVYGVGYNQ